MALVSFAGLMSGLTLGLMSLTVVDLEVLIKAGQPQERKNAGSYQYFLTVIYFLSLLKHLTECFLITCYLSIMAEKILPIVKNQHLLLCTLLIGNALAMEVYVLP
jgi:metal transporter CNNM